MIVERHGGGQNVIEYTTASGGFHYGAGLALVAVLIASAFSFGQPHFHYGMHRDLALFVGHHGFKGIAECHALALLAGPGQGDVVVAQHDILRRRHNGMAVAGGKDIVRGQHQHMGFDLRFDAQRQMNGHLVAVEVGIEALAYQGMNLYRVALDQHRLKGLDAHTVEGGSPVQEDRMLVDYFFQNVPNALIAAFEHLLGRFDGIGHASILEAPDNKGLIQLQSDALGKAALIKLQFRADYNHGSGGIVYALTQQVLAEASLLALDHIGQALERTIARTEHRTTTTSVVQQGVDGLLQHPLFITDNHFGGIEVDQFFQSIVAVDDPAVQVVQIAGGEITAFEQHQGS